MYLNREENYKYQKLGIIALSKALDDICPTFENEPEEIREHLIKERIKFFKIQEKELDREWREMEAEALAEVRQFKKDRDRIFKKLEKTVKTKKIEAKVKDLQHRKQNRIEYLQSKKTLEESKLTEKLGTLEKNSKKYQQASKKLSKLSEAMQDKIRKAEIRFNTIINNTLNSDNSKRVEERLKASHEVWERKYQKLKNKFNDRELIHNNKRFELDQVRLAIEGFVDPVRVVKGKEVDIIKHWCTISGVSIKSCYTSVKERILMVEREVPEIIEELSKRED